MNEIISQSGDYGPMETILSNVPRETKNKIFTYVNKVVTWNLRTNLTGAETPQVFFRDHILDCYLAKGVVDPSEVWVDVGSGNGLPGVVWACLAPEEKFFLVESSKKKAAFLQGVKASLRLSNMEILPYRFESIPETILSELCPLQPSCVSRGTADPSNIIRMARATKLAWRHWYVFSSQRSHQQFLTLLEKSDMRLKTLEYDRYSEGTPRKGTLSRLEHP